MHVALLASNAAACGALAALVAPLLGPRSHHAAIVARDGELCVTNDGATALALVHVPHPAARMVVELALAQDRAAGDGTTSVVLVSAALLRHVRDIVAAGFHPAAVSAALACAARDAVAAVERAAVRVADVDALLHAAVRTALNSKLMPAEQAHLRQLAVRASASASTPVLAVRGGLVADSELLAGVVWHVAARDVALVPERAAQPHADRAGGGLAPSPAPAPTVAVCFEPGVWHARDTSSSSPAVAVQARDVDDALREHEREARRFAVALKARGIRLVLVQRSPRQARTVSDAVAALLARLRIAHVVLEPAAFRETVVRTGVPVAADVEQLARCAPVGVRAALVAVPQDQRASALVHIECDGVCTCLCRGASEAALDEARRALGDALRVARMLRGDPRAVLGGGCAELGAASALRRAIQRERASAAVAGPGAGAQGDAADVSMRCRAALAQALEDIPRVLCRNAGLDELASMSELQARHISSEACAWGVYVPERVGAGARVCDLSLSAGHASPGSPVVEPVVSKVAQIRSAVDIVRQLVRCALTAHWASS